MHPGSGWIRERYRSYRLILIQLSSPIPSDLVALLLEDVMTDEELEAVGYQLSTLDTD